MKLRTILATKGAAVVTAHATQTIKEATTLLVKHKIGVLLVVDETNQLLGILSERDIIREAARRDDVGPRLIKKDGDGGEQREIEQSRRHNAGGIWPRQKHPGNSYSRSQNRDGGARGSRSNQRSSRSLPKQHSGCQQGRAAQRDQR